ncbi:DUF4806 domain-containing protein, partial [Aphis craccivora]
MWSVVVFGDETVEAIPHHWYKNSTGTCAWPKKPTTAKRKIETRVEPNIFDFDFYKARILRSNIETLEIAKRKAKQAQDTSDLGTCDDEEDTSKENRKYKSQKVMFSPQISKVRSTSQQVSKPPLFEKIHMYELSSKKQNFGIEEPIKSPPLFDNGDILTIYNKEQSKGSVYINNDSPSSNILICDEDDIEKDKNYTPTKHFSKYEPEKHSGSKLMTINSPSGAWTVSSHENINSPRGSNKFVKRALDFNSEQNKSTPNYAINSKKMCKIIESNNPSPAQTLNITPSGSLKQYTGNMYTQNDKRHFLTMTNEEFQDKMFRSIKQLNYIFQGMEEKLNILEKKIDVLITSQNVNECNYSVIPNENIETNEWPIFTDDQLGIIETKLESDTTYKKLMVKKFRVLNGKDVGDSVRRIMKCMFCDTFLGKYSFIGFKKKRSFSNLLCCRLIFDAIKADSKFQDVQDVNIEKAIKSWLGQAPFR